MYDNYIFDLYGTLVDIHTDEDNDKLWEHLSALYSFKGAEYKPKELQEQYQKLCAKKQAITKKKLDTKYPEILMEEVFFDLYRNKGIIVSTELAKTTGEIFRILSTEYIKLYDGAIDFLETLKKNGKKIYLLSNAQRIFTLPEIRKLGIEKYFDAIYFSSDHARTKPDSIFMETLIQDQGLKIERSIMIGNDAKADIGVANNVGMDSLYIHSNISPKVIGKLNAKFKVMDGDLAKALELLK